MGYLSRRQYNDFDHYDFLMGPAERRNTQRLPKMAQRRHSKETPFDTIPLRPYQYQDVTSEESPAPYDLPSSGRAPAIYNDPYEDPNLDTSRDSNLYQHGGA